MTPRQLIAPTKPRRPHMTLTVKLEAALRALGLDPAHVEWHHEPPLSLRPYDAATNTWSPDANDPRHIIPLSVEAHKARTPGDISVGSKVRETAKKELAFRARLLAKAEGDTRSVKKRHWPSRPMQSRKQFARQSFR